MHDDARRHSPAAERNRGPILAELQRRLPVRGRLVEIASGSGQHASTAPQAYRAGSGCPASMTRLG